MSEPGNPSAISPRVLLVAPPDGLTAALAQGLTAGGREVAILAAGAVAGALDGALVYRPSSAPGRLEVPDLEEAGRVLQAAADAGGRVERFVLLSSTLAYAPHHHHPGLVAEGQIHPPPGGHPVASRWRALEAAAEKALAPAGVALVVLRAAPAVWPGGGGFFNRLLRRRLAFPVAGYRSSLQLLAPADLAAAIHHLLGSARAEGLYHLAPAGTVPAREAARLAGARTLPLPYGVQRLAHVAPAAQLDYLRHQWTAAGRRLERELGFRPRFSSAAAVLLARGADPGSAPAFDAFGMDAATIAAYGRTLFRFLARVYWRVEARGLEHVPRAGRAVLAGVHRGFQPWDGVMTLHLVHEATGRVVRFLVHPTLVKFPFLADFMTRLGGILACQENADRVLAGDGLLGVYPEGIQGAFTPYRRAYELGKFGRDEFVRMALRNRAPIVPFVTVGSAEIYPILARLDWGWWKRWSEWPCFPITPTFPWLPLPLPSKWHTWFLPPLPVHESFPPEAAEDRAVVRQLSLEVRRRLQEAMDWMRARRPSIWRGSVFGPEGG